MATMSQGTLVKDSIQRLALRSRYIIENLQLVFPKPVTKGEFGVVKKAQILAQRYFLLETTGRLCRNYVANNEI